jgi:hypothetical protein
VKQDIRKWLKTKICSFYEEFEKKKKKDKNILTFRSGDLNPRFSVISCPRFEFSWKVRETRSNLDKEVKISQLYGQGLSDYRHPERAFFKNLERFDLGRHFELKFFEAFGVFLAGLSAPILVL